MTNANWTWKSLLVTALMGGIAMAGDLEQRALKVLDASCSHCHDGRKEMYGDVADILDINYLRAAGLVDLDNPLKSRVLVRMKDATNPMPPADAPRDHVHVPSTDDIQVVTDWLLELSSLKRATLTAKVREDSSPVSPTPYDAEMHLAIRKFLERQPTSAQSNFRFLSFTNIDVLRSSEISIANQLRRAPASFIQAAATKAINSLHWSPSLVELPQVGQRGLVLAIPLNQLRDREDRPWSGAQWDLIAGEYPYGLRLSYNQDHLEIVRMTGTSLPVIRGDWFLANALRPPLYHQLLQLPANLLELEDFLGVKVEDNILAGRALRVGFIKSGVSKRANRLAERHESRFGYYWKSYDFLSANSQGNIVELPTGPVFERNPFNGTAFKHDGGEVIFSLPNGLQGFYLANAAGCRIDAGPAELVSDDARVAGTPLIVNGLSCIACHAQGVYPLPQDDVLRQTHVEGEVLQFVKTLHRDSDSQAAQQADRRRFRDALQKAIEPYLNDQERTNFDIQTFPEPIKLIASHYINSNLQLEDVAAELSISSEQLKVRIQNDPELQRLGLTPLTQNRPIKRDDWENTANGSSKFQLVARQLGLGTPLIVIE